MAKDPWPLAAKARNDFADVIDSLNEDQLAAANCCGTWTPKEVMAHVLFIAEMKMPNFMLNMAKAGFNYDKMADRVAVKMAAETSTDDLVARLRASASRPAPVPGFTEMIPTGDVAVHTQDVRRSLNLDGELDGEVLAMALRFVTEHKIGMDLADVGEDVRFEATDVDWSHGEGPVATGPGEAILMTLAGRATGELTGDGAAGL